MGKEKKTHSKFHRDQMVSNWFQIGGTNACLLLNKWLTGKNMNPVLRPFFGIFDQLELLF